MNPLTKRRLGLTAALAVLVFVGRATAGAPFDDAAAVWRLGDPRAAAQGGPLAVAGNVQLGVGLSGPAREAALCRGGDGRVARFDGGFLHAGLPGGRKLQLIGKEMTLGVRLQDPAGMWSAPLLSHDAPDDPYADILAVHDQSLEYVWRTEPARRRVVRPIDQGRSGRGSDFVDGVLRLRVPLKLIGTADWHDVVVRFREANLELFVDGVLVDEEWPHGGLYEFGGPFLIGAGYEHGRRKTGFHGLIDHVALWNRALRDDEIAVLCGGRDEIARRDLALFGPRPASAQYWKPRGYNAWAGDCMPFFHDGTFRLFYLFDRHHHGSKWHMGAHQYGQLSSRDLVHWQEQPLAVPILRQWECSMGTCDCIFHDGLYRMFYTDCGGRCEFCDKPQPGPSIFCSTSRDGVHFQKDFQPLVPGGDCTVFRDPATGLFHMVRGGGNRLVSRDLRHWEEIPGDFVTRKPGTTGECPHEFAWNGWYYFILGTNALWKSRSAIGPWEEMPPTIYDGLFVPKVAEFTGNRRILAGFLFERGWAGHLALRELVQYADGSLGSKFPPELVPAGGPAKPAQVRLQGGGDLASAVLEGMPRNVRITMRVLPQPGVRAYGLCLRATSAGPDGCELRFEPPRKRVQYGTPRHGQPAAESTGLVSRGRDFGIEGVAGLDRPLNLEIVVKDDIIDACIDGRRTMITRRDPEPAGDKLWFFAHGGEVKFETVEIHPLPSSLSENLNPRSPSPRPLSWCPERAGVRGITRTLWVFG